MFPVHKHPENGDLQLSCYGKGVSDLTKKILVMEITQSNNADSNRYPKTPFSGCFCMYLCS